MGKITWEMILSALETVKVFGRGLEYLGGVFECLGG